VGSSFTQKKKCELNSDTFAQWLNGGENKPDAGDHSTTTIPMPERERRKVLQERN